LRRIPSSVTLSAKLLTPDRVFAALSEYQANVLHELAGALAKEAHALRDGLSPPVRERLLRLRGRHEKSVGAFFSEEEWIDVCAQTQAWYVFALELGLCGGIDRRGLPWIIQQEGPLWKEILETSGTLGTTALQGRRRFPELREIGCSGLATVLEARRTGRTLADEGWLSTLFEQFLAAYDSRRRRSHGVFYTPPEITRRLVRDVDAMVREEFHLANGLADCAAWKDVGVLAPAEAAPNEPFIRILDPAAGSGVFLVAVIEQVHSLLTSARRDEGEDRESIVQRWNSYVPRSLLPRLFGLELSPAACFAAHLEIALALGRTGYDFSHAAPIQVFTANTLAEEQDGFTSHLPMTVIIGNPPFAALSQNRSPWIAGLLKGKAAGGSSTASYFEVDGSPLRERKHWLHDDYVKFLRYAQWRIENAGCGVIGLVTNHSYLDNPTFRGVRRQLMHAFSRIDVIDLHGNRKKRETAPSGDRDENVFPIDQGVALSILCKRAGPTTICRADVWGTREKKQIALDEPNGNGLHFTALSPTPPFYFFAHRDESRREEYHRGWPLTEVMPLYVAAPVTARDGLVVAFTREELQTRIAEFCDLSIPDQLIRERYFGAARTSLYSRGDTRGWKLAEARRRLAETDNWEAAIRQCLYRPFDRRWIYWSESLVDWPRRSVMRHLESPGNLALIARRQMPPTEPCRYFWVSDEIVLDGVIRSDNRGGESVFPLFLLEEDEKTLFSQRRVNFSAAFLNSLPSGSDVDEDDFALRLFGYIYALFHSSTYRTRYAEHLRIDFPRVFVPWKYELLSAMSELGSRLIRVHTGGKNADRGAEAVSPEGVGSLFRSRPASNGVKDGPKETPDPVGAGFPKFDGRAVSINPHSSFAPVPREAWEWQIGGHQVCRKWLKDRKGRVLTDDNIATYERIVRAATETQRLTQQIDSLIDRHGGFPDAFAQ
jgi:predicted helicase